MELNPNHIMVKQAHSHWHAIAALIMVKLGKTELDFTAEDVKKLQTGNVNIVLDATKEPTHGILSIRLVDNETAFRLAAKEGGRSQDN